MKTFISITSALALIALTGCSKTEPTATAPEVTTKPAPPTPVETAPAPAQATAEKAAADAQAQAPVLQNAATQAVSTAQVQADTLTAKNQTILDRAKQLIADNKPVDALKALTDLAAAKLTPQQQSTLDALKLKAQELLQKAAASNTSEKAADAIGGLLKK